jgi:hypothetical protein
MEVIKGGKGTVLKGEFGEKTHWGEFLREHMEKSGMFNDAECDFVVIVQSSEGLHFSASGTTAGEPLLLMELGKQAMMHEIAMGGGHGPASPEDAS